MSAKEATVSFISLNVSEASKEVALKAKARSTIGTSGISVKRRRITRVNTSYKSQRSKANDRFFVSKIVDQLKTRSGDTV